MKSCFITLLVCSALIISVVKSDASKCLSSSTCNMPGGECCGIAKIQDTNYTYSACIPESGAGQVVRYKSNSYLWNCIPSTYHCINDDDCTAVEKQCCGNITVGSTTVLSCINNT